MIRVIFLAIFAISLQMVVADPRKIEGFTYLGDVPTLTKNGSPRATYYVSTTSATWPNAFQECNSYGGRLATPLNPNEDNALRTFMNTASFAIAWIGGRATGANYRWEAANLPIAWSNFHPTGNCKASNMCLSAFHSGAVWGWCGYSCNNAYTYVCEF